MSSIVELGLSNAGAPGTYLIEVIESPAGEAAATFALEPDEFIEQLDDLQETLLASSVPSRRVFSRGESSVREMGQRLFDALFSAPEVAGVYRASCAVASERGESLRFVLRIAAPELAALPWESIFDAATDSFVSRREPLVRYVPVPSSPPPLTVALPLRVLALIASPRGLAPLDVEKEQENLTSALQPLLARDAVSVHWLAHATWASVQDALLSESWHVVHFIGHGDFDVERDEGLLALESDTGRVHRIPAESFADLLREAQPMPRLVVLNACETAASGRGDLFSGAAASLVRRGVSAVTAMQFEISDPAAIAFCRGFYSAIGRGRGVDEAVRSGRVAILGLGEGSLEWITPTLYLRGRETHLFEVSASPLSPAESTPARAPVAAEAAAADPPPAAPVTPAVAAEPDRVQELLAASAGLSWTDRPHDSDVKGLAQVLLSHEQLVGVVRLPFSFWSSGAVVITDQNLYVGASRPNAKGWAALRDRLPAAYRVSSACLRVPLDDLEGPVTIEDSHPLLTLRDHGTVPLSTFGSSSEAQIIEGLVMKARDARRGRAAR